MRYAISRVLRSLPPFVVATSFFFGGGREQLVRELLQAEEDIRRNAITDNGGAPPPAEEDCDTKKSSTTSRGAGGRKNKRNHDDKNIRRRVYDALNVLMAMNIITKNKKEITWRGLPGSAVPDRLGYGSGNTCGSDGENRGTTDGLSRRQRVHQLRAEACKRREDVRRKTECLRELMVQNVCFQNLLGRNYARAHEEDEARRTTTTPDRSYGWAGAASELRDSSDKGEKIPLPFIIVSTDSTAVVQCEMRPGRTDVCFDFNLPFEINDDNEILKRLGM
jgi:transcription factor Dp-1